MCGAVGVAAAASMMTTSFADANIFEEEHCYSYLEVLIANGNSEGTFQFTTSSAFNDTKQRYVATLLALSGRPFIDQVRNNIDLDRLCLELFKTKYMKFSS